MQRSNVKSNNNFVSWLWSYVTWSFTKLSTYAYPKSDATHKKYDDHPNFGKKNPGQFPKIANVSLIYDHDENPPAPQSQKISLTPWIAKLSLNKLMDYSEWAPYKACRRAYNIVAPIIGPKKLQTILVTEFFVTLFLNITSLAIATELAKDKGAFDSLLSRISLKDNNDNNFNDDAVMSIAKNFGYHCALSSGIFLVNQAIVRGSELIIKFPSISKLFEKLFSSKDSGQPLYLSALSTEGANAIVPSVPQSLGIIVRLGNKSYVSAVSAVCSGVFSAVMLCNNTTKFNSIYSNPIIPKLAFSFITSVVSGGLNYIYTARREDAAKLITEVKEIESNNYTPQSYVSKSLIGGGIFSVYQSRTKMDKVQEIETGSVALDILIQGWSSTVKMLDKPINYFLTAMQLLRGCTTAPYTTTLMHLENVSGVTNWGSDNSRDIADMNEHLNKLERFGNILDESSSRKSSFTRTYNGLTQEIIINGGIYKYEPQIPGSIPKYTDSPAKDPENYKLIYYAQNLTIPLETKRDERTVKVRALVTAPAGIGKSTLLNALHGKSLPAAPLTGTFCFPEDYDQAGERPNIFMVPQDPVMPLHVSFLEILCYPTPVTTSRDAEKTSPLSLKSIGEYLGLLTPFKPVNILTKERENEILTVAAYIIKELGFSNKFESFFKDPYVKKSTWGDKSLSGGEKRAIPLVWAILQNPKILFMDEADANLDGQRGKQFQKILNELLPDTSILVISHNDKKEDIDPTNHLFYNHICALEDYNMAEKINSTAAPVLRADTPMNSPLRRNNSVIDNLLGKIKLPSSSEIGDTSTYNSSKQSTSDFNTIGTGIDLDNQDIEGKFSMAEILRKARGEKDTLSHQL